MAKDLLHLVVDSLVSNMLYFQLRSHPDQPDQIYENAHNIGRLKQHHGRYFRLAANSDNVAYRLGLMMWTPKPVTDFGFEAATIFDRYGGKGAWSKWQQDGTINTEGFFEYSTAPTVFSIIEEEFNMFKHHAWKIVHGRNRLG